MLKVITAVALEAGKLACSNKLSQDVHQKGHVDFVTEADLAVSDYLKRELSIAFPGSRVLSEDSEKDERLDGGVFIIDPIDGTTNLMYQLNLSAISIGYVIDGQITAGVVFNPFSQEMFAAELGKGATLNGNPIHVNNDATPEAALVAFEAGPATLDSQECFLQSMIRIHRMCRGMRFTGSAAIDLCYTACGRFTATAFHYLFP